MQQSQSRTWQHVTGHVKRAATRAWATSLQEAKVSRRRDGLGASRPRSRRQTEGMVWASWVSDQLLCPGERGENTGWQSKTVRKFARMCGSSTSVTSAQSRRRVPDRRGRAARVERRPAHRIARLGNLAPLLPAPIDPRYPAAAAALLLLPCSRLLPLPYAPPHASLPAWPARPYRHNAALRS